MREGGARAEVEVRRKRATSGGYRGRAVAETHPPSGEAQWVARSWLIGSWKTRGVELGIVGGDWVSWEEGIRRERRRKWPISKIDQWCNEKTILNRKCYWGYRCRVLIDQKELHRKSTSDKVDDRREAIDRFCYNFSKLPDKSQAQEDLHRLTTDEDPVVRQKTASALGEVFPKIPDKDLAWEDLHRISVDEDLQVRYSVSLSIGKAFSQIPDKDIAWKDLHKLTNDEDFNVRGLTALALSWAFSQNSRQRSCMGGSTQANERCGFLCVGTGCTRPGGGVFPDSE